MKGSRECQMGKDENKIAEQIIKPDAETAPVNSTVSQTKAVEKSNEKEERE